MKRQAVKQEELLFDLVGKETGQVIHLPYTEAFERACANQFGLNASIEQKHDFWERLLEVKTLPTASEILSSPNSLASDVSSTINNPLPATAAVTHKNSVSISQPGLFVGESVKAKQPWNLPAEPALSPELQEERVRMLAGVANSLLGNMEQRVVYLLNQYPETRENDTALSLRYWRRFQADVLESCVPLELEILYELDKMETIGRIRRHVQNDLRLFRGMEQTGQNRDLFQKQFHEYLAAHKGTMPEIRFYLDETGNEGEKAYAGIGGLSVINWQQYEKYHAALAKWRRKQNWPETIHFSETGSAKADRALRLLGELERRRAGLLFLGYALPSRGRTHQDLLSLLIQLVMDSLKRLKEGGCLEGPRSIRVLKEADSGFDAIYLEKMSTQLSELVALEYPDHIIAEPVEAIMKGREVFLECADLVAGGMQRRALYKGRNPKDTLAEAVLNVTGFEDSLDRGAVFKLYPAVG
jgi:hypothetical protein